VTFQDVYSQNVATATAPNAAEGTGGTNPQQIGMGVTLSSIDVMHTSAPSEYTGSPLDLSISGDGYFAVSNGGEIQYTRAGNFKTDGSNNLVTSDGMSVMGWTLPAPTVPATPVVVPTTPPTPLQAINISDDYYDISISKTGEVVGINNTTKNKEVIAKIAIANFNNQNGLEKVGGSLYAATLNSGTAEMGFPGTSGVSTLTPSSLEMSNVDLAKEFTDMIITQRGYQANSRVITTSDQLLEELVNLKR